MEKKKYNNGKSSPKFVELTNKRFGNLVAKEYVYARNKNGVLKYMWLCDCDCGETAIARTNELTKGIRTQCKKCSVAEQTARKTLPENESLVKRIYRNYQRNAENRDLKFDISIEELKVLIFKNCEYCGSEPKIYDGEKNYSITGEFKRNGIDRIDSSKGYIVGNLKTCCPNCNFGKSDNTEEEFKEWVIKVYKYLELEKRSTTIPSGSTAQTNGVGNSINPIKDFDIV